ncbi:hypothetical protein BD769DRAFT_1670279 [Suillus cothurnatus]|nr:hypothetical protein BD769DRAFT_1670279 [Suillus cothurnatus]
MPGIARSIAKKKQMAHAEQEKAYAEVMKEYQDEQKKPESERKSRKAICRDVAEKWKAMKKPVTVGDDEHGVNEDKDIDSNDSDVLIIE